MSADEKIIVRCPQCKKEMKFSAKFSGKTGICVSCGTKLKIEESITPPSVQPTAKVDKPSAGEQIVSDDTTPLPIKKAKEIIMKAQRERGQKKDADGDEWEISTYFGKPGKKK